jgi:hypothetical protein
VVLLPALDEVLRRSRERRKRVRDDLIHHQHAVSSGWPLHLRVDCTKLSVDETLTLCRTRELLP